MKKYLYFLLICLSMVSFSSCDSENSKDDSKITHFVEITLKGDTYIHLRVNDDTYVEPGYTATEGSEDVTANVVVTGTVDTSTIGAYILKYSCVNTDGFSISTSRCVYVTATPLTTDISGNYTVDAANSYRINSGKKASFAGNFGVTITSTAYTGFYIVSDLFGGWYDQGASYGSNYAAYGHISLNSDNSISYMDSSVAGWGDSCTGLDNTSYNAATNTLTWDAAYAGKMVFHVVLIKN